MWKLTKQQEAWMEYTLECYEQFLASRGKVIPEKITSIELFHYGGRFICSFACLLTSLTQASF